MLDFYNRKGEKIPFKRIILPLGLIFLPSLINKVIFEIGKRSPYAKKRENIYESFLGKVNFSVKGEGRPVLLVHDTFKGGGSWEWMRNLEVLSEKYKVFALDLPGFGLSQKPWTVYTAYDYTRLIKDFLREVVGEKAYAIASGESAAFLVQAAFLNEDLFEKLIVVSPSGVSEKGIMDEGKRRTLSGSVVGTSLYTLAVSRRNIRNFMEEKLFYNKKNVSAEMVGLAHFYAHIGGERGKHAYASRESGFLKTGILESFKSLKIPVLTAWGEENAVNPARNMNILERLRPELTYALFEKTSMAPHLENPYEFNRLAVEFFEE